MPTYTTSAKVLIHLPSSPPASVTDNTAADIADASAIVDSLVGKQFGLVYNSNAQKFPQITDSPATPAMIELCARYLAAASQMDRVGDQIKTAKVSKATVMRQQAHAWLKKIKEGEIEIILSGSALGDASALAIVEDEIYVDLDSTPIFNKTDLDVFKNS